jgi:hypothetical protein
MWYVPAYSGTPWHRPQLLPGTPSKRGRGTHIEYQSEQQHQSHQAIDYLLLELSLEMVRMQSGVYDGAGAGTGEGRLGCGGG